MAADAVAGYVYMVEIGRQPAKSSVTIVTGVAAGNMSLVLASRSNTVMATEAVADYVGVVENSR
jgi:hypothetical protein